MLISFETICKALFYQAICDVLLIISVRSIINLIAAIFVNTELYGPLKRLYEQRNKWVCFLEQAVFRLDYYDKEENIMKDPVMIRCPYHPQKRFFKCKECNDIEVECEFCKAIYNVSINLTDEGFKSEFKFIKKIA